MKKIYITLFLGLLIFNKSFSQDVSPANVYPSNLEENMYFEKYDDASKKIKGVKFLILADGSDSKKVTPAFSVKLYIMPEGKSSEKDLVIVKTYQLPGLYQMGSKEYLNEEVDLSQVTLPSGRYRLGIWVNADKSFNENPSDNATLFTGVISYTAGSPMSNNIQETKSEASEAKEEINEEREDMSDEFNANFNKLKKGQGAGGEKTNESKPVKQIEPQKKEEVKQVNEVKKEEMKQVNEVKKEEVKKASSTAISNEKKNEVHNNNSKAPANTKSSTPAKASNSKAASKPTAPAKKK